VQLPTFRDGAVDEERLAAMVRAVGKERLVLDLSCRKKGDDYFVVTVRPDRYCVPRHRMPFNSRKEGSVNEEAARHRMAGNSRNEGSTCVG